MKNKKVTKFSIDNEKNPEEICKFNNVFTL